MIGTKNLSHSPQGVRFSMHRHAYTWLKFGSVPLTPGKADVADGHQHIYQHAIKKFSWYLRPALPFHSSLYFFLSIHFSLPWLTARDPSS